MALVLKMNQFLDRISSVLEQPVDTTTRFRELPGWSSLMAFGILVTLENDYGKAYTVAEFRSFETVGDLAKAAGL